MSDRPPIGTASPPIFLSYASEDQAAARRIADSLRAAGLEVWFDQSELRGGDAWDQRIRRQIKDCALFIPVISAHTQARAEGYFRLEWHLAEQRTFLMAQHRAFIVPVVVDDTADADAFVPDRFRERQWTRVPDGHVPFDFAARMAQLLGAPAVVPRPGRGEGRPAPGPAAPERSVAVLAFANISEDRENEYFAEGISDELLTVLKGIPGLQVAARTSAFSFRGKNVPVREIGSQLDVAHLVEGGVQKSGNRVKVVARLTSVASGQVLWSRSYTREIKDVFALQEELATAIVGELRGQLVGDEATLVQQASRGGTRSPEAYQEYLLGKHLLAQWSQSSVPLAVAHFRRALAVDRDFALAWLALGQAQVWRSCYDSALSRGEIDAGIAEGREALDQAQRLESDLAGIFAVRGWLQLFIDFDLRGAAATLEQAQRTAPDDVEVVGLAYHVKRTTGDRAASLQLAQRTVAIDPLNSESYKLVAFALAEANRFEEAQAAGRRFRDLNPSSLMAAIIIGYLFALEGRCAEAQRSLGPAVDGMSAVWLGAIIYHRLGDRARAEAALQELTQTYAHSCAIQIATVHAVRDEPDQAFSWLAEALRQRDSGLIQMFLSPFLASLRGDRRWNEFWRPLGFAAS